MSNHRRIGSSLDPDQLRLSGTKLYRKKIKLAEIESYFLRSKLQRALSVSSVHLGIVFVWVISTFVFCKFNTTFLAVF